MPDPTFTFELEEFELPLEGFEAEVGRRRRPGGFRPTPRPSRPSPRPSHPRRPGHPGHPGRRVRRIIDRPMLRAPQPACPTVLVLEGYGPGSIELEPHHEEMLKRLAEFITASKATARNIEMIAWGNAAGPAGATLASRLKKASQRLAELLQAANRSLPVRESVRSTEGPERVEIRLCM